MPHYSVIPQRGSLRSACTATSGGDPPHARSESARGRLLGAKIGANGADLAPKVLHERASAHPVSRSRRLAAGSKRRALGSTSQAPTCAMAATGRASGMRSAAKLPRSRSLKSHIKSQRAPSSADTRPRSATECAGRRHTQPQQASSSHCQALPDKEEVGGSSPPRPTQRSSRFTSVHVHVWVRHFRCPGHVPGFRAGIDLGMLVLAVSAC